MSVHLVGVSKAYPAAVGLRPTDLAVETGDRLALVGPSGSGKSTLLRLVAGLEAPDAGTIRLHGRDATRVPPHRRGVGFLPQRVALYPHRTVADHLPPNAGEILDLLRLTPLANRYPHQLSGGERQRVGLARLAARRPAVWLLDEPFAGLDPGFRGEFRGDLHLLLVGTGATMIVVTHDPDDALALGRRVGVLGDGRIVELGPAEELRDAPRTRLAAACLGRLSLIDGSVREAGDGGHPGRTFVSGCGAVSVPVPAAFARRGPGPPPSLTLGIRPEDVTPVPPGSHPPDQPGGVLAGWPVVSAEPVGSGWLATLARGRTRVRAWLAAGPPPVGRPADWFLPADRCLWFTE